MFTITSVLLASSPCPDGDVGCVDPPVPEALEAPATREAPGVEVAAQGPPAMLRPPGFPEPGPEPVAPEPWTKDLSLGVFADAYASINYNLPRPQTGTNATRAYDVTNGLAFSWAGLDASYERGSVGGTLALRFGPSAVTFNGAGNGMQFVKQAYATWSPKRTAGILTIDMGKFDTLYGAEVAESHLNQNYTRGVLNWLGQPGFHTGIRANVQPTDSFGINLMLVNGWNNVVDNNRGKTAGVQLAFTPGERFSAYLGYATGPEGDEFVEVHCAADTAWDPGSGTCEDAPGTAAESVIVEARGVNRQLRHFADLVLTVDPHPDVSLVINGDFGTEPVVTNPVTGQADQQYWFGGALGLRWQALEKFATAVRGEYYQDLTDYTTGAGTGGNVIIGTGTLTLEYAPLPNLLVRLDNRVDASTASMFQRGATGSSQRQFTSTLGVVVRTR